MTDVEVMYRIAEAMDHASVRYKVAICKSIDAKVARMIASAFMKQSRIVQRQLPVYPVLLTEKVLDDVLNAAFIATYDDMVISLLAVEPAMRLGADAVKSSLPEAQAQAVEAVRPSTLIAMLRQLFSKRKQPTELLQTPDLLPESNAVPEALSVADMIQARVAGQTFVNLLSEWLYGNARLQTAQINATTLEQIRQIRATAIAAGETPEKTTAIIAAKFGTYEGARSEMIAGTEVSRAFEAGGYASIAEAMANGVEYEKQWLAEMDPTTCDDCANNDTQGWIAVRDAFESGDDAPPQHPNCRCTVDYRPVTPTSAPAQLAASQRGGDNGSHSSYTVGSRQATGGSMHG